MLAVQADNACVDTVEGLTGTGELNYLQDAFRRHHGLQCGFCTPGMLMSMTEYLRNTDSATDEEIRDALGGNICRCTGYQGIVEAVKDTLERRAAIDDGSSNVTRDWRDCTRQGGRCTRDPARGPTAAGWRRPLRRGPESPAHAPRRVRSLAVRARQDRKR